VAPIKSRYGIEIKLSLESVATSCPGVSELSVIAPASTYGARIFCDNAVEAKNKIGIINIFRFIR
jgi:hypothetical protein